MYVFARARMCVQGGHLTATLLPVLQVSFILPAVGAMAYYAMWTGLGVEFKTTDSTPRVIFWARYVDYVITLPVSITDIFAVCLGNGPIHGLCRLFCAAQCYLTVPEGKEEGGLDLFWKQQHCASELCSGMSQRHARKHDKHSTTKRAHGCLTA
jgi:hypothetical protein